MAPLKTAVVAAEDAGLRLDRWFKTHYPGLGYGELQKLMRTGQIRVDGRRAKANLRLAAGMEVRVPPLARSQAHAPPRAAPRPPDLAPEEARALRRRVLYRDDDVIVIDKPAGLAVQGGTRVKRHLDGMLDALRFGARERPRLVHRLDKDTSGVLVLARNREAARWLTAAFRGRDARKLYLAVTAGQPKPRRGRISLALAKGGGAGRERMETGGIDAQGAVTLYDTLDAAGDRAALVALMPLTGRTHQLRAHMAAIGTPILGDGKYGGKNAFLSGDGLEKRLHLHARAIEIAKPGGGTLRVEAPLPPHMETALAALGFGPGGPEDRFPRD
ncbi:MAG: RluA family pseudouridine synthase [Alphaproteobacteria bacterium]|nr:RluA family pseudouridine synthase [Alphaproteobacteria bacterium]